MKKSILGLAFVFLAGCTQNNSGEPISASKSSSAPGTAITSSIGVSSQGFSSSAHRLLPWKTYHDPRLGISFEYPAFAYSLDAFTDGMPVSDHHVAAIEGLLIGHAAHLYRTKDPQILTVLQQDKPFVGKKTVNGVEYQQFQIGEPHGNYHPVYGFVAHKNGYYYVVESTGGSDQTTLIDGIVQSLKFTKT